MKGYYFSPQELRIITDGRCGSACSQFIKRTSELKLTKIISLYANLLGNNPHDNLDTGGFAASSIYDSNIASQLTYEGKPPTFPQKKSKKQHYLHLHS